MNYFLSMGFEDHLPGSNDDNFWENGARFIAGCVVGRAQRTDKSVNM